MEPDGQSAEDASGPVEVRLGGWVDDAINVQRDAARDDRRNGIVGGIQKQLLDRPCPHFPARRVVPPVAACRSRLPLYAHPEAVLEDERELPRTHDAAAGRVFGRDREVVLQAFLERRWRRGSVESRVIR